MTEYYIQAYPKMYVIYASTPAEALEQYRQKHPEDTREYMYTGAYHKFVIIERRKP